MAFTASIFMKFAVCQWMFVDIFGAKFYPEWMKNAPTEKCSFRARRISTHVTAQLIYDWSPFHSIHFKIHISALHLMTHRKIHLKRQSSAAVANILQFNFLAANCNSL